MAAPVLSDQEFMSGPQAGAQESPAPAAGSPTTVRFSDNTYAADVSGGGQIPVNAVRLAEGQAAPAPGTPYVTPGGVLWSNGVQDRGSQTAPPPGPLSDAEFMGGQQAAVPAQTPVASPDFSYGTDNTNVGNPVSNFFKDWSTRAAEGNAGVHAYVDRANNPTIGDSVLHGMGMPTFNDIKGAGSILGVASAPVMAVGDQIVGRPAAVIANRVNDATGIAPSLVANPHAITDIASIVQPLADAAVANRAISTGAKAAGITEKAFMERQAAQAAASLPPARPGILGAVANTVSAQLAPIAAAINKGSAEKQAAGKLASATSDLPAARTAIMNAPNGGILVPGSAPTTGELTGDLGILSLQRGVSAKSPALFADRAAAQSSARTGALQGLLPVGDPMDVAAAAQRQYGLLEANHDANVLGAKQAGDNAVAATTAAHDTTVSNLTQGAQAAAERVGGVQTPDAQGAAIRDNLISAAQASKEGYGALYKAVDPTGTMALDASPVAQSAASIKGQVPPTAEPMGSGEAGIYETAAQLGQNTPMRDMMAFRVRVGQAASQAKLAGDNIQAARLNQLRGAIDDALAGRVSQQVQSDQAAVQAGHMAPDAAMAARYQSVVDNWRQQRAVARAGSGGGNPADTRVGAASVSGPGGAAVPASGGPGGAAGNTGIPQASGPTPYDPQAADRLNAANAAFAEHQRTFGVTPVAQTLRSRSGYSNDGADFVLPDGSVPGRFFKPGVGGFDAMSSLLKASPQSLPIVEDYAATTLRNEAMGPNGTIDPGKFATWQRKYGDALRALPDATKARFQDAASASQAVTEAAANRTAAIKATQTEAAANVLQATQDGKAALAAARQSAPGKLLGRTEPEDVTAAIGSIINGDNAVAKMGQLSEAARSDPNATAGLRRAVMDHLVGRLLGQTEAGTTGILSIKNANFQDYLARNRPALSQVLKPEELDRLQAISEDISRSRRSQGAVSLKNGSTTTQDAHGSGLGSSVAGHVSQSMLTSVLAMMGSHEGGVHGAIGGLLAGSTIHALRSVGVAKVDDLVARAVLDPQIYMRLTSKLPAGTSAAQKAFAPRFQDLLTALAASNGLSQSQSTPSSGLLSAPPAP